MDADKLQPGPVLNQAQMGPFLLPRGGKSASNPTSLGGVGEGPQPGKVQLLPGAPCAASTASCLLIPAAMDCLHSQFTAGKMREDRHPGTPGQHT